MMRPATLRNLVAVAIVVAIGAIANAGYRTNPVQAVVCAAHQWVNQITGGGVANCAQPGFSDLSGSIGAGQMSSPNKSSATPTNPAGTTSTSGVMMGLAGSITPNFTGVVEIKICGDTNNNTAADGVNVWARYGTGSAPANAAAATGTQIGNNVALVNPSGAVIGAAPFCVGGVVSGLTLSTAYWIDAQVGARTGGTAAINDVTITANEIK